MNTFIYHTDPGHGWIEVPRSLLDVLGIASQISAYSYSHGDRAFLEEDCDAARFAAAMNQAGQNFDVVERHTDGEHWIRRCARFI